MIFFDTDCISSFLWVNKENLLLGLELGELVIPREVFIELSNPSVRQLGKRVSTLLEDRHMQIMDIMTDTEASRLFYQMAYSPMDGYRPIGKGEAAVLALAIAHGGIVASNNLRDISPYVTRCALRHITTGYILAVANDKGLIDKCEGNRIWDSMLKRRRKLPTTSFTDYLKSIYPRDQLAASFEG